MEKSKRYLIFIPIMVIFFVITFYRLYDLNVNKREHYLSELKRKTNRIVEGGSAPRGRILDRNGNILVDNVGVTTINYTKVGNVSVNEEIEIARALSEIITLDDKIDEKTIKNFWILTNNREAENLITKEEYRLLEHRKLTNADIHNMKLSRITDDMLSKLTEEDILAARIYELMNKGYKYQKKIIKSENVTEEEIAILSELRIRGITLEQSWKRKYPFYNTMRSILGNISSKTMGLPLEEREYFLALGYSLNDRVGISYLEKQYEKYLKGEKDLFYINIDNTLSLYKEGRRGNDLVLSIDINIQKELEDILMSKILEGRTMKNTEHFKHAYAIVSDPITAEIIAMSGKELVSDGVFVDITSNIINSSYTLGSVVKAASMTVGFQNDLIEVGKKIKDGCVKLYYIPEKCSFMSLGLIDDIGALKWSSNYYQFLIAIALTGNKYTPNMKLNATREHFDIYRETFASFGLGTLTGIDLPNEKNGIIGELIADDLLLNLTIGQYDTYTPIQLLQYINTIANNGVRIAPSLMLRIIDNDGNIIKENNKEVLNKVDIKEEHLERIKRGLIEVARGTSAGYMNINNKPAGKTGTSESFLDSDGDGRQDISTITMDYAAFAPYDDPRYSIVVIVPNISHNNGPTHYIAPMNRLISRRLSDFLFENY